MKQNFNISSRQWNAYGSYLIFLRVRLQVWPTPYGLRPYFPKWNILNPLYSLHRTLFRLRFVAGGRWSARWGRAGGAWWTWSAWTVLRLRPGGSLSGRPSLSLTTREDPLYLARTGSFMVIFPMFVFKSSPFLNKNIYKSKSKIQARQPTNKPPPPPWKVC